MEQNYVGKLQEIMVKVGIKPIYDLMESNSGTHVNKFKVRLTCQVSPDGPTNTVYGEGLSKKAAKHAAALIFLRVYLNECNNNNNDDDKNNNNVSDRMQEPIDCIINVNSLNRIKILQIICDKNGFEKPKYFDVLQAGPAHSTKFRVACKVGRLRTESEGLTKTEARLDATNEMIKLLMEAQNIYEVFESSNPKVTDSNSEIVCFSDNITGARAPNSIGLFGRRLRRVSTERSSELENQGKLQKLMLALMKSKSTVGKNDDKLGNSVCRSLLKGASNNNNFQTEVPSNEKRSKSLNDISYRIDNKGAGTSLSSSVDSGRMRNRSQAIGEIDRALENAENQLYEKILNNMEQESSIKKVTILYDEFDVFIDHGTRAKITNGCYECTDISIRIACLSKFLMDLREYAFNKS